MGRNHSQRLALEWLSPFVEPTGLSEWGYRAGVASRWVWGMYTPAPGDGMTRSRLESNPQTYQDFSFIFYGCPFVHPGQCLLCVSPCLVMSVSNAQTISGSHVSKSYKFVKRCSEYSVAFFAGLPCSSETFVRHNSVVVSVVSFFHSVSLPIYSSGSLEPAALRRVPGFPSLRLLRRLRQPICISSFMPADPLRAARLGPLPC